MYGPSLPDRSLAGGSAERSSARWSKVEGNLAEIRSDRHSSAAEKGIAGLVLFEGIHDVVCLFVCLFVFARAA